MKIITKKQKIIAKNIILVKFFFIFSVIATFMIFGTVCRNIWSGGSLLAIPVNNYSTEVAAVAAPEPVDYSEVRVDDSKQASVCGITLKLPSIAGNSIVKNNDENMLEPGLCSYVSAPDRRFRILVIDTVATTDKNSDIQKAFDRYLSSQNAQEIKNIAITDLFSTGISDRILYERISPNQLGYTAQIFQDIPGRGVYQTATYLDSKYLVYLTHELFDTYDTTKPFIQFMKDYSSQLNIQEILEEINESTKSIQVNNTD